MTKEDAMAEARSYIEKIIVLEDWFETMAGILQFPVDRFTYGILNKFRPERMATRTQLYKVSVARIIDICESHSNHLAQLEKVVDIFRDNNLVEKEYVFLVKDALDKIDKCQWFQRVRPFSQTRRSKKIFGALPAHFA